MRHTTSHTTKSVTDLRVAIFGVHDPSFSEVINKKEKNFYSNFKNW